MYSRDHKSERKLTEVDRIQLNIPSQVLTKYQDLLQWGTSRSPGGLQPSMDGIIEARVRK
jgi:hypothetical protein